MTGIFKAYDIRGIYGEELTVEMASKIGMAFGTLLDGGLDIIVGRDSRLTSALLERALISGLMAAGCKCEMIGLVPTPIVYFASTHYGDKAGVMVTASHNPPQYNGFKFCRNGLSYSYETGISKIEDMVGLNNFALRKWNEVGKTCMKETVSDYIDYVTRNVYLKKGLKIVVDAGNGTCGFTGKLFKDLGCRTKVIFSEPDGRFPNHIPDPLREETLEALCRKVLADEANLGVAFDGDGDRVGFVDEKGRPVKIDFIFMLLAREILSKYPNSKIIFNVLGSKALFEDIKINGGKPIMTRVGHSYIQEALYKEKAALAGEVSGHFFFGKDYYGYDDGILAAIKLVELLSRNDTSLSEMIDRLPKYYASPEMRIKCSDNKKFLVIKKLTEKLEKEGFRINTLDGVRVEFEDGWGIVRASNTEPALVLRFEATSQKRLDEIKYEITDKAEEILRSPA